MKFLLLRYLIFLGHTDAEMKVEKKESFFYFFRTRVCVCVCVCVCIPRYISPEERSGIGETEGKPEEYFTQTLEIGYLLLNNKSETCSRSL